MYFWRYCVFLIVFLGYANFRFLPEKVVVDNPLVEGWKVLHKADPNGTAKLGKKGELEEVRKYLDKTKENVDDVANDIETAGGFANWKATWDKINSGVIFKLSEINDKNFHLYFKEITDLREASKCNSNCTVVSLSVAKKAKGEKVLGKDKFSKEFVGDGESGIGILNQYVDLVPQDRTMPHPFPNPFLNRMLKPANAYRGNINNTVLVQRLFGRVPNGTNLIFASYKGLNKSDFTGHAFNVIKDENGLIKFIDVQLKKKLEYGEGVKALVEKMKQHGLENPITKESSSWHFYDASIFKK